MITIYFFLIAAPIQGFEKPKCLPFIQLLEIRRQAKLSKFKRWLESQKKEEKK